MAFQGINFMMSQKIPWKRRIWIWIVIILQFLIKNFFVDFLFHEKSRKKVDIRNLNKKTFGILWYAWHVTMCSVGKMPGKIANRYRDSLIWRKGWFMNIDELNFSFYINQWVTFLFNFLWLKASLLISETLQIHLSGLPIVIAPIIFHRAIVILMIDGLNWIKNFTI